MPMILQSIAMDRIIATLVSVGRLSSITMVYDGVAIALHTCNHPIGTILGDRI